MGVVLHLAEGIVPAGVLRLTVVEGFMEPGEHALCTSRFAFFNPVDELVGSALDKFEGAFDT
jgi:hypothetical protein